jgi:hypothetical protein
LKFAGLDPGAFNSGKSIYKKARLSKAGNRRIRSALYMPTLSAKTDDPLGAPYFQHLLDNGKPFDNTRFYATPATAA